MTKKKLILAVDDRRDNLFVLEELLAEHFQGHEVVTATGAEEGLRLARAPGVDTAVIDVQMPGIDGLEMTRRLKADSASANVPVLLLTAHRASSRLRAEGLDAGADDFITKPIDNHELVARVRALLRVKQAEDELRDVNAHLEELVTQRTRELRESHERLRQAEKMEAVGQLAGGIAHDFNNLLTAIQGSAELLRFRLEAGSQEIVLAERIVGASDRAADLTRQLLTFARKGKGQNVCVDLHVILGEVVSLLSRSIDRKIEIRQQLRAAPPTVTGDPAQLQSALLNLGLNARDAMPDGGLLEFATRTVVADESFGRDLPYEVVPGPYVEVQVRDSGAGMSQEILAHVFEPFFTTKEVGKGTGLGLASVYGCAKSHRGYVGTSSRPGEGTTFTFLLPEAQPVTPAGSDSGVGAVQGQGHILVVDDIALVLETTKAALQHLGYRVSTCSDGAEAVELIERRKHEIDLVILDLNMPRMDGREALRRMKAIDPEVRVLLATGHGATDVAQAGAIEGALGLLAKPYRLGELAAAVARHLTGSDC